MENIGERVRQARLLRGYSQTDLARVSGVHKDTISTIELGKHTPHPSTQRRLAEGLGIEVAELLGKAPASVGSS